MTTYESDDEKPIGTQGRGKCTDNAKLVVRPIYPKPTEAIAFKKTTTCIAAKCGTNNQRTFCHRLMTK